MILSLTLLLIYLSKITSLHANVTLSIFLIGSIFQHNCQSDKTFNLHGIGLLTRELCPLQCSATLCSYKESPILLRNLTSTSRRQSIVKKGVSEV